MSSTNDDPTANDDPGAAEAGDSAAETLVDPREAQRRRKGERMLGLWRAGVAGLPEVAWRDAGATSPIAPGQADDGADDEGSTASAGSSWWSMPTVRSAP